MLFVLRSRQHMTSSSSAADGGDDALAESTLYSTAERLSPHSSAAVNEFPRAIEPAIALRSHAES
jgi:hypothetical protein